MAERRDEELRRDATGPTQGSPAADYAGRPDTRPETARLQSDVGAATSVPPAGVPGLGYTGTAYGRPASTGDTGRVPDRQRVYENRTLDEKSPAELERDIRRTRAEMTDTVDAIERKLSPDYLKHELKESMHEGIDYLRERFDPRRIAKNTGRSMLDTIKENPVPSLIAGLSIGWLIMKGNEHDDTSRRWDSSGYRRSYGYGRDYERDYGRGEFYGDTYYRSGAYASGYGGYSETYAPGQTAYGTRDYEDAYRGRSYEDYDGDGGRQSLRDRVGEKADEIRHRTSEMAGEAQHRMQDMGHEMQDRMHDVGRRVQYGTRRTVNGLEHFINDNPLAAGALALGIGALLGALLPSTEKENAWMGETRDRLVHQAREVVEQTVEQSKPIAQQVVEDVKETAKDAAREVASVAKEGAREVTSEAKAEAEYQIRERT